MLFSIYALDKPNALELRQATRAAHLDYAKASGKIVFGGPMSSAEGEMIGSLIVIEAASLEEAERFAADDPYAKAGLFESVQIRPFKQVFGA